MNIQLKMVFMTSLKGVISIVIMLCLKKSGTYVSGNVQEDEGNGICKETKRITVTEVKTSERLALEYHTKRCRYSSRTDCLYSRLAMVPYTYNEIQYKDIENKFCCQGYVKVDSAELKCEPECIPKCHENAICTAPGVCTCKERYTKKSANECVPTCVPECVNATCTDVDICSCLPGFEKISEPHECSPHCTQKCLNGFCSAPETCQCDLWYELSKTSNYTCDAVCGRECIHGKCVLPNQCECDVGYEKSSELWNLCIPKCEKSCGEGDCTGPNECTCYENHILVEGECKPDCPLGCENGACLSPGNCWCYSGYRQLTNETTNCSPVCDLGCEGGTCTGPEQCTCSDGYAEVGGTCTPQCNDDCVNSNCTEPNVCTCLENSIKFTPNECIPLCSDGSTDDCYSSDSAFVPIYMTNETDSLIVNPLASITLNVGCDVFSQPNYTCSQQNLNCTVLLDCFTHFEPNSTIIHSVCVWTNYSNSNLTDEENLEMETYNMTEESILTLTVMYPIEFLSSDAKCSLCFTANTSYFERNTRSKLTLSPCPISLLGVHNTINKYHNHIILAASTALILLVTILFVLKKHRRQRSSFEMQERERRVLYEDDQVNLVDS